MTFRRSLAISLAALLLAALALWTVLRLRMDTSLAGLFDPRQPAAAAMVRVMEHFKAVEELIVLAETDSPQPQPEQLTQFAQRLESQIKADPSASNMSEGVIWRADEQQRKFFEQVLVPHGLFYLDDAALEAAKKRLTREEMTAHIRGNEAMIATPGPAADALSKVLLKDPLRLHEFLLDRITASRPFKTYQASDAFLSPDGQAILIRIRGRRPVNDLQFAREFTSTIESVADRANTDHLRLHFTGAYAIAAASERAIRSDMIATVIGSVISLQLLFALAYRRPIRSFLFAFTPVVLGVAYGFGAYAILSRALTPMTAVIGGVLAGMAIDYAIAFLAYYQAERAVGLSAADAASAARRRVGVALLAAWATSVAGFVAIGFSNVKALRDFSLLGSLGLTGAFLCSLIVLPALLALFDRGETARPRLPVRTILAGIARQSSLILSLMFACFAAAVIGLLLPGTILPLESDLSVMHPHPNPPLAAQDEIADRFSTSPGTLVIHLHANNTDELLRLAHQVESRLRAPAVRQAGIAGTFGLASLLPDPTVAPSRVHAAGPAMADRVIADFHATIADSMFEPAAYEPYTQFLRTLLTAKDAPTIADLLRYPSLAETILPAGTSTPTEAITLVFVRGQSESREARDAVVNSVRAALADAPGATLTGLGVLNHDIELSVRRDLPRLVFAAVAAATLYLALHFRNLADCILSMLPTIFGLACLLAFMRLTGQRLNMANLVAFPLLIGIDVDYGIFLVSAARWRELKTLSHDELLDRLTPAASAVVLCAAATATGFGSLAFTSIPAVQSLGIAVTVGVIACLAATLLLVVPILFLANRRFRT
jgi:predicted RND superfamily exporter protein